MKDPKCGMHSNALPSVTAEYEELSHVPNEFAGLSV